MLLPVPCQPHVHAVSINFCDGAEVQAAQVGKVRTHPQLVVLQLRNGVPMQRQLPQVRQLLQFEHLGQLPDFVAVEVQHLCMHAHSTG